MKTEKNDDFTQLQILVIMRENKVLLDDVMRFHIVIKFNEFYSLKTMNMNKFFWEIFTKYINNKNERRSIQTNHQQKYTEDDLLYILLILIISFILFNHFRRDQ